MLFVKAFVLLVAILGLLQVQSFKVPDETEAKVLSQALKKIVKEIIAPINQTVNVITCHGAEHRLSNLMTHLMKDLNDMMTFTNELRSEIREIYGNSEDDQVETKFTPPASIIICDEWNIGLDEGIINTMGPQMGFITYVSAAAAQRYINTIHGFHRRVRTKTLLLVDDGDYLYLKIASFFSESSCTKAHLRTINRFSKKTRQWDLSFDIAAVRANNHGCAVEVQIFASQPEIIGPDDSKEETDFSKFSGYFTAITNELTRRLNFKLIVNYEKRTVEIFLYGYSGATLASVFPEVSLSDASLIYRDIIFIIPLGNFYTGLEKLFLPFDYETWIMIGLTFAVGLMTILIVTQLSLTVQSFVIGRGVSAPTMNLLAAFFGLGQTQLPGRNFARFLLTLYIIWCLIIRTAYQGVLYDLLKGDGRKAQNMQFDDFVDNNATFHYNTFCELSLFEMDLFSMFVSLLKK